MGFRALRSATRGYSPLDSRKPFEKGLTENFYFPPLTPPKSADIIFFLSPVDFAEDLHYNGIST